MNKYQKALDRLFMWSTNGYCALVFNSKEYKDIKATLQELVDRSTPNKPILLHSGYDDGSEICDTWDCPTCGETFVIEGDTGKCNYCPNCGQKLLWDDKQ